MWYAVIDPMALRLTHDYYTIFGGLHIVYYCVTTHGRQVIIPNIINGLYAPHQGFFPRYAGGFYTHDELTYIVNRGLSLNFLMLRIFNPPEFVIIIIEGGEDL